MEPNTSNSLTLPIAIIVGFAFIAIAIYFGGIGKSPAVVTSEPATVVAATTGTVRPIDSTDYIRGNPNAPIMLIEYSDYDCPFCKQYHDTLTQVINEYGVTGQVGWVYRQFPIAQLHPNAPKISQAALCVGELGGTSAFWKFSDSVFFGRKFDSFTSVTKLDKYATEAGITLTDYQSCMSSGRHSDVIEAEIRDAFAAGVRGTPHTVLVFGNEQAVLDGALTYNALKGIINNLIGQLEGTVDTTQTNPATVFPQL